MARQDIAGGWVDLRDPKEVPERLRRPITKMSPELAKWAKTIQDADEEDVSNLLDEATLESMYKFNDLLAIALIKSWSFGDAVTMDTLLDLPGETYDAIQKVVAPMYTALTPNFEIDPAPDSPTEPSNV